MVHGQMGQWFQNISEFAILQYTRIQKYEPLIKSLFNFVRFSKQLPKKAYPKKWRWFLATWRNTSTRRLEPTRSSTSGFSWLWMLFPKISPDSPYNSGTINQKVSTRPRKPHSQLIDLWGGSHGTPYHGTGNDPNWKPWDFPNRNNAVCSIRTPPAVCSMLHPRHRKNIPWPPGPFLQKLGPRKRTCSFTAVACP